MRFTDNRANGLLLVAVLITGCASNVPVEIREAPPGNPSVTEVRRNIDGFIGADVRWGGVIAAIDNQASQSLVEIVARDLYGSGRPRNSDYSPGRFIAVFPGFLEPSVFAEDRELTVSGIVLKSTHQTIGEFEYTYPVIKVVHHQLWQPLPERDYYSHPYNHHHSWDDPWYDPWHHHNLRHHPYYYRRHRY